MAHRKYKVGDRFGTLVVTDMGTAPNGHTFYICQCDCGTTSRRWPNSLTMVRNHQCSCKVEPMLRYFKSVRKGARTRGIEFKLTKEFIQALLIRQANRCALSGVSIDLPDASLDRIDSSHGYTEGNVQWVHKEVNFMKGSMTMKRLLLWCERLLEARHFDAWVKKTARKLGVSPAVLAEMRWSAFNRLCAQKGFKPTFVRTRTWTGPA